MGAIGLLLLMALGIVAFFYFSRRKIVQAELEKANLEIAHQKEMLQATIRTQEEERSRIAQDMHDAISSKLNVVSLNANFLADPEISSEEANKMGATILQVTGSVLENSRRIAHDLLPPTLSKFGLQAALEELCEEVGESGAFAVQPRLSYKTGTLAAEQELHLFRIVQELINNSIKHSQATELGVSLESTKNNVSLHYQDNGKGFDPEAMRRAKGLGMTGIENRVAMLDGRWELDASPGNGIQVAIHVDLEAEA